MKNNVWRLLKPQNNASSNIKKKNLYLDRVNNSFCLINDTGYVTSGKKKDTAYVIANSKS